MASRSRPTAKSAARYGTAASTCPPSGCSTTPATSSACPTWPPRLDWTTPMPSSDIPVYPETECVGSHERNREWRNLHSLLSGLRPEKVSGYRCFFGCQPVQLGVDLLPTSLQPLDRHGPVIAGLSDRQVGGQ